MLPVHARVDLGAMATKGYSSFSRAPTLLDLTFRLFSVNPGNLLGVLTFCRYAVGVFYSPSRLGHVRLIFDGEVRVQNPCD